MKRPLSKAVRERFQRIQEAADKHKQAQAQNQLPVHVDLPEKSDPGQQVVPAVYTEFYPTDIGVPNNSQENTRQGSSLGMSYQVEAEMRTDIRTSYSNVIRTDKGTIVNNININIMIFVKVIVKVVTWLVLPYVFKRENYKHFTPIKDTQKAIQNTFVHKLSTNKEWLELAPEDRLYGLSVHMKGYTPEMHLKGAKVCLMREIIITSVFTMLSAVVAIWFIFLGQGAPINLIFYAIIFLIGLLCQAARLTMYYGGYLGAKHQCMYTFPEMIKAIANEWRTRKIGD